MTQSYTPEQIKSVSDEINVQDLKNLQGLLLFVGHAHSGHSIIGATLDAHSQIAIANEVNVAKLINDQRITKKEIESILLYESFKNKTSESWHNSEYQHGIKASYQGQTKQPLILGDKKAGGTTRVLFNNFWVLDYLLDIYGDHLKLIFVNRKPIDIVAAYSYYMKQEPNQFLIDRYMENLNTVNKIKKHVSTGNFIQVEQSEFIHQPITESKSIFNQLNISVDDQNIKHWVAHVRSDIEGKSSSILIPKELSRQLP